MASSNYQSLWRQNHTSERIVSQFIFRITANRGSNSSLRTQKLTVEAYNRHERYPIGFAEGQLVHRIAIPRLLRGDGDDPDPDLQRCLRTVFRPGGIVRNDIIHHKIRKGSGVWGIELQDSNICFIDCLWTDHRYRQQKIATEMIRTLKMFIRDQYNIGFILMEPGYLNAALVWDENRRRPWDGVAEYFERLEGTNELCPCNTRYRSGWDLGDARAIAFWRSVGARRIGITEIFGIAMDRVHPANSLLELSVNDKRKVMTFVCPYPDHDRHDEDRCVYEANSLNDQLRAEMVMVSPEMLQTSLEAFGERNMMARIARNYNLQPVIHIAAKKRWLNTLQWFIDTFPDLVSEMTDDNDRTVSEAVDHEVEMSYERRIYGEEPVDPAIDRIRYRLQVLLAPFR